MEKIGQIAALAVISAIAATVIRKQLPDLALVLALCGVAGILAMGVEMLSPIRQLMDTLAEKAELSPALVAPVVKTVGIGLLTRICAELCRDARESGLATAAEMAGTITALWTALPLFEAVLGTALELF